MNAVIETHALSHRYGGTHALQQLDLAVPEGSLYGLLGPNGAGKTTTLDILMNLVRPTAGEAKILGHPCHQLGPQQLQSIGYVSAEQDLPKGRTVEQLCAYLAPLYPTWDRDFAAQLCRQIDLPRNRKLGKLSRGQRMKAALVLAMAFRPKVLLLDEPFSGLDALVRDELVTAILDPTQSEGWTVLLSSHDLEGLEPLVDRLGILQGGTLVLDATIDEVAQRFRRVEVLFDDDVVLPDPWPTTWRDGRISGRTLELVETAFESEASLRQQFPSALRLETSALSLRQLFLAMVRRSSLREGGPR